MPLAALIAIRTFANPFEAEIARSALEAAGITALRRCDDCGGAQPSQWLGGIALLVHEDDARAAREILDSPTIYATRSTP
jgi:hypothetical protein